MNQKNDKRPDPKAFSELWISESGPVQNALGMVMRGSLPKLIIICAFLAECYIAKLLITVEGLTVLQLVAGVLMAIVTGGLAFVLLWWTNRQEGPKAEAPEKPPDN